MEAEWSRQARTPTSPKVLKQKLSVGIHRIPIELSHSSKLEPRNPIELQRILTELLCSSYEEVSWQGGRPSCPQSLATLPTRHHLATTLRMRALQVEFSRNGVCVFWFPPEGGLYRVVGELHRLGRGGNSPSGDRSAGWNVFHRLGLPLLV
jgi:hypothetical protein